MRVGPQLQISRLGVDQLRPQHGITLKTSRGQQGPPSLDRPQRAVWQPAPGTVHYPLIHQQRFGPGAGQHVSPVFLDPLLASRQVVRGVELVATAVPQHGHGRPAAHAEGTYPLHAAFEAAEEHVRQIRVTVRVHLGHDVGGRRGPGEAGVDRRPADLLPLLHQDDPGAVGDRRRGGRQVTWRGRVLGGAARGRHRSGKT